LKKIRSRKERRPYKVVEIIDENKGFLSVIFLNNKGVFIV